MCQVATKDVGNKINITLVILNFACYRNWIEFA